MQVFRGMSFDLRDWPDQFEGKPYRGEKDPSTGKPEGYGVLLYPDGEGKPVLLYAGAFRQGLRHGRGYLLRLKEVDASYERKPTYEEVMSTAEFDSCGRVIHVDNIQSITVHRTESLWMLEQDGLWEEDAFVEPCPRDFTPWKESKVYAQWDEVSFGSVSHSYMAEKASVAEAPEAGDLHFGWYDVQLTPLPDGRLLLLEDHGLCVPMVSGDVRVLNHGENPIHYNRYTYSLDVPLED